MFGAIPLENGVSISIHNYFNICPGKLCRPITCHIIITAQTDGILRRCIQVNGVKNGLQCRVFCLI